MENPLQIQGNDPKRLDGFTFQQIIDEITQVSSQYEQEVLGGRRHWPESIRARILALGRVGIPRPKIADLTSIPRATVFACCKGLSRGTRRRPERHSRSLTGEFIEISANRGAMVSPTVRPENLVISPIDKLVLVTPDGFRFELSDAGDWRTLCAAYRELRQSL